MIRCHHCAGFIPHQLTSCPHCDAQDIAPAPLRKAAKRAAGAALMMVSLMACYGAGYDDYPDGCNYGMDSNGVCNEPPEPEECGNGVLESAEECDDGGRISGDGCSAGCRVEHCDTGTTLPLGATQDSTASAQSSENFHSDCGSFFGLGRERIFEYTAEEHGILSLTVDAGHAMYASTSCTPLNSVDTTGPLNAEQMCAAAGESLDIEMLAAQSIWLFVEQDTLGAGPFTLQANFERSCGDGVLQSYAGEKCDPGKAPEPSDCNSNCQLDGAGYCGNAVPLVVGAYEGTTADGLYGYSGEGCEGNDKLLSFVAPENGTLLIKGDAEFDLALKLIDQCSEELAVAAGCINDVPAGGSEVAAQVLTAGQEVWLVVDGVTAEDEGVFGLDIDFLPATSP